MANLDLVYSLMKYEAEPEIVKNVPYYTSTGEEVTRDIPIYSPQTTSDRAGNAPRKRPNAYILPKTEINAIAAARVGIHGVKYHVLTEDTKVNVEVFETLSRGPLVYWQNNQMRGRDPGYSATTQSADLVPWIPGFLVKAAGPVTKTVDIPKGSYVIYTSQPLGAYLAAVMEPDAERSFARLTMARRLERDPTTFANDPKNWVVPYRYMDTQTLKTKEVVQFYPLVEKAMVVDIRPKTGNDLPDDYVMMQDIDVISDADGFVMQVPASMKNLDIYAYDWNQNKFTELKKAYVNYDVSNVYAVTSNYIGPAFEGYGYEIEPLSKAMNSNMVRIAAKVKHEKPKPPKPDDHGCNAMALPLCLLALIPVFMRKRG
jgi:hypothetical protein